MTSPLMTPLPSLLLPFAGLRLPPKAASLVMNCLCWDEHYSRFKFDPASRGALPLEVAQRDRPALLADILSRQRDWTGEDADGVLKILLDDVAPFGAIGWLAAAVQIGGLDVDFRGGEPVIPLERAAAWQDLNKHIDGDVLIAYVLARKRLDHRFDDLTRWRLVARVADRDLEVLLSAGVADMHIHLGGLRSAEHAWLKMLLAETRLEHLPHFSAARRSDMSADDRRLTDLHAAAISRVLGAQRQPKAGAQPWEGHLSIADDLQGVRGVAVLYDDTEIRAARYDRALRAQRRSIIGLLVGLMPLLDDKRPARPGLESQMSQALGTYLLGRSAFLSTQQQGLSSNPGLKVFQRYFGANQVTITPKRNPARWQTSIKLAAAREYIPFAHFLQQSSPTLRHCELRLTPLKSLADYVKFFRSWKEVEDHFEIPPDKAEDLYRFAIHFVRGIDPWHLSGRSPRELLPELVLSQRYYDRASSALHAFRTMDTAVAKRTDLARWIGRIGRIDVAGQERATDVERVAFQMRLLRGDADALEAFRTEADRARWCDISHHHWLVLGSRPSFNRLAPGAPRLRITAHAGEDFAHPLEGLYAIDRSIDALRLTSGDSIGHALALACDVASFDQTRAATSMICHGVLADAVLWLRNRILTWGQSEFLGALPGIENWLSASMAVLYKMQLPHPRDVDALSELRAGPIPARTYLPRSLPERLRQREVWDTDCVKRRRQLVRLPDQDTLALWRPAIIEAQTRLVDKLAQGGIPIELNPSSNLRISGAHSIHAPPFLSLLDRPQGPVLATLNSDDPGVFATRIENEYAYVLQALRAIDMPRARGLWLLEQLRLQGLAQAFHR